MIPRYQDHRGGTNRRVAVEVPIDRRRWRCYRRLAAAAAAGTCVGLTSIGTITDAIGVGKVHADWASTQYYYVRVALLEANSCGRTAGTFSQQKSWIEIGRTQDSCTYQTRQ